MLSNTALRINSFGTSILFSKLPIINVLTVATMKKLPDPPEVKIVGFPENPKLKMLPKQIQFPSSIKPPKMARRLSKIRGPELIHNKLIHKQYGIVALSGGQLLEGHYKMIQTTLNKKLDYSRAFAIWRIDPPSRSVTKHGQGKKLGGGKGAIDHYMLPIKRGRVIIEVGGKIDFASVSRALQIVAENLPFPAKPVTQEMLDEWEKSDEDVRVNNLNQLKWEWCIKNNILNCLNYAGRYDIEYSHLGPDCR